MPVVSFNDYAVEMLRELTVPVVKHIGYTCADPFPQPSLSPPTSRLLDPNHRRNRSRQLLLSRRLPSALVAGSWPAPPAAASHDPPPLVPGYSHCGFLRASCSLVTPWSLPGRFAANFRLTSDGSLANTANGLLLAVHKPSGRLTFLPRVNEGADASHVCPTRDLVERTPSSVRRQLWDFPNGCQFFAVLKGDAKGEGNQVTDAGCTLPQCGTDVPCCVHYMPSAGATQPDEADRYQLYQAHVGRHHTTKWSPGVLQHKGWLMTDDLSYSEPPLPCRLRLLSHCESSGRQKRGHIRLRRCACGLLLIESRGRRHRRWEDGLCLGSALCT